MSASVRLVLLIQNDLVAQNSLGRYLKLDKIENAKLNPGLALTAKVAPGEHGNQTELVGDEKKKRRHHHHRKSRRKTRKDTDRLASSHSTARQSEADTHGDETPREEQPDTNRRSARRHAQPSTDDNKDTASADNPLALPDPQKRTSRSKRYSFAGKDLAGNDEDLS
jgi:hypothetical protein